MLEPTFDKDGYPTDDTLQTIAKWPDDWSGLVDYVEEAWEYEEYFVRDGRIIKMSTGGWSGNEDIVLALQNNFHFWITCWVSSTRGGHFVFELPS